MPPLSPPTPYPTYPNDYCVYAECTVKRTYQTLRYEYLFVAH